MSNLINLTDTAKEHLISLSKEHNKKYVRLEVKGGGCAGFKYEWSFDDVIQDTDESIDFDEHVVAAETVTGVILRGLGTR